MLKNINFIKGYDEIYPQMVNFLLSIATHFGKEPGMVTCALKIVCTEH